MRCWVLFGGGHTASGSWWGCSIISRSWWGGVVSDGGERWLYRLLLPPVPGAETRPGLALLRLLEYKLFGRAPSHCSWSVSSSTLHIVFILGRFWHQCGFLEEDHSECYDVWLQAFYFDKGTGWKHSYTLREMGSRSRFDITSITRRQNGNSHTC